MAQNEGMEAAGPSGTTGSRTSGSESSGARTSTPESTGTRSSPSTSGEQGRAPDQTSTVAITGREQQPGQSGSRLSRRDVWDDPFGGFFGVSPFALFRKLSDDMERVFFGGGQGLGAVGFGQRFIPNVDVEERDDRIVVRADLPGVKLDDFRVEIEDDALVLQGERRSEREDTRGGVRRFERSYGTFRRVIQLPRGANPEAAEAKFENGVLEIDIPLQQQSQSRRVEVKARSGGTSTSSGASSGSSTETTRH
ncbi:MAG TPA: Hsp20/alpha crystallin family protein [Myxococcaceae bacterium]|nr:Hsp20/alpha crystallin family protein [Myxococcaceae bacterium]